MFKVVFSYIDTCVVTTPPHNVHRDFFKQMEKVLLLSLHFFKHTLKFFCSLHDFI